MKNISSNLQFSTWNARDVNVWNQHNFAYWDVGLISYGFGISVSQFAKAKNYGMPFGPLRVKKDTRQCYLTCQITLFDMSNKLVDQSGPEYDFTSQ